MKVHVWIGTSHIAGKGLFAGQAIKKDTVITRYLGTKISKAQSAQALAQGNAYIWLRSPRRPLGLDETSENRWLDTGIVETRKRPRHP